MLLYISGNRLVPNRSHHKNELVRFTFPLRLTPYALHVITVSSGFASHSTTLLCACTLFSTKTQQFGFTSLWLCLF